MLASYGLNLRTTTCTFRPEEFCGCVLVKWGRHRSQPRLDAHWIERVSISSRANNRANWPENLQVLRDVNSETFDRPTVSAGRFLARVPSQANLRAVTAACVYTTSWLQYLSACKIGYVTALSWVACSQIHVSLAIPAVSKPQSWNAKVTSTAPVPKLTALCARLRPCKDASGLNHLGN